MASYEKIDYSIRPNKALERRLLFQRLAELQIGLVDYEYVGFGSMWFVDFLLAHRMLGISTLVSVEAGDAARAEFNRPLGCIKVMEGISTDYLRDRQWDRHGLFWLDYDGPLDECVMEDLDVLENKALAGDLLFITVNANHTSYATKFEDFIERMRELFGDLVPSSPKESESWGRRRTPKMLASLIFKSIRSGLQKRGARREFLPMANLVYADGATMLTVGGSFVARGATQRVGAQWFSSQLPSLGDESEQVELQVPVLTRREKIALDRLVPGAAAEIIKELRTTRKELSFLRDRDIRRYVEWYRHFPVFADIASA